MKVWWEMTQLQTQPTKFRNYFDGDRLENIDHSVLDNLKNFKAENSIDFVGMIWTENYINVFWPKGFKINPEELSLDEYRKKFLCLLKVLRKFSRDNSIYSYINGENKYTTYPIEIDIIEDYLKNGLYENSEFRSRKSAEGKINWKKTISQSDFYLNKKNIPIYLDFYSFQRTKSDSLVVKIHKHIIQQAFNKIGWLFYEKGNYMHNNTAYENLPLSKTNAVSQIRMELKRQFSEIKINQLKMMENFLLEKSGSSTKKEDNVVGINAFHVVWEKMCASFLNDQKSELKSSYYPVYSRNNEVSSILESLKSNSPKPDIIIFDGSRKIAIVDAKYYDFKKSKPGWSDLVKQFFYAKLYLKEYPQKIENFFIVPDVGITDIKRISVVSEINKRKEFLDDDFPSIKIYYMNVDVLMSSYVNRKVGHMERKYILEGTL